MKKYIINENKLRTAIRQHLLEQESTQEPKEEQKRCLTTNTVNLDEIVGLNDGFKNYTSKLYKKLSCHRRLLLQHLLRNSQR